MTLNDKDRERIRHFYTNALRVYGPDDPRSLQWTDARNQVKRFAALAYVDDISGKSILDVGCGLGDLYQFLRDQNIQIDYTGIDIVPEMVTQAREKFPSLTFEEKDVFDIDQQFDYVFASGALSFKVENNDDHYKAMIEKMYEIARVAVAFNMLDKRTHPDTETYAAYDPEGVAHLCSSIAPRVEIAIDYLPQDFTVYLYKDPA